MICRFNTAINFIKWSLLLVLFLIGSCSSRDNGMDSGVAPASTTPRIRFVDMNQDAPRASQDGGVDFELSWTCAGSKRAAAEYGEGPGIRQNEYCEWDRAVPKNQKLQCDFRTTFDASRRYFLNMRGRSTAAIALDTRTNTYTAFAGNSEPPKVSKNKREKFGGLFGDCLIANARCQACRDVKNPQARELCEKKQFPFVACDAERESDFHVCKVVQDYAWNKVCSNGDVAIAPATCETYRCVKGESNSTECLMYDLRPRYKVVGLRYSRILSAGAPLQPQLVSPVYKDLPREARLDMQFDTPNPFLRSHFIEGAAVPTGDTRFKFELRFNQRLAARCKYIIDPYLKKNADALRTAVAAKKSKIKEPKDEENDRFADEDMFLLPDKTLVRCEFDGKNDQQLPNSCDDLAQDLSVVMKGFVSNGFDEHSTGASGATHDKHKID